MSNTELWDALGKTDPSATKKFSRSGGFKGTSVKPMWAYKRLTEHFGPVGVGWGHNQPVHTVTPGADGEVLVYCTVECWHTDRANTFYGVGGDKVIVKDKNGLRSDDEAFKKAFTDAVMNAFKSVGVAADIHMGLHDDDKYVSQLQEEFTPGPEMITDRTRDIIAAKVTAANYTIQKVCNAMEVQALTDLTEADGQYAIGLLDDRIAKIAQKQGTTA